ncbi:hypothetical protein BY996DRAFT_6417251 [Phakopsora pachyrhizi]|nr:hypothetical protein BY996DRAFT_6417251 [Phakopsora pachyrhizi]
MDPKYFQQITFGGTIGDNIWKCLLCKIRPTTNIIKHSNTEHHKTAVREVEKRKHHQGESSTYHWAGVNRYNQMNTEESDCENPRGDDSIIFNDPSDSEGETEPDAHSNISSKESSDLQEALSEISEDMESIEETNFESNFSQDSLGDNKERYPFKKKEIMIGCILAGCTRSLMSRKTYDHIRLVLRLCNVDHPSWRTVQSAKAKLQKYTYCRVQKSELGNPLASKFVEFYPELSNGKNLYKLAQSEKWLHQYPRNLRPQMISFGGKHYYIYVPVQLIDGNVVVPVFFYTKREITSEGKEIIQLPNPWRVKADGKMIRHIPLNFYSDDTSGNVSKQWNKHISIFMSLAGLPPKLSNQEFNTLFVATSNIATALELAAPVCDELNNLSLSGFTAFDYSLQEHVLVLPVVLLFMADLPMHAEITSTMQPNVSLQPWSPQKSNPFEHYQFRGKRYVEPDSYERFDGHKDTPVEVLHVVLLGILKYLYRDLIGGLSANKKE